MTASPLLRPRSCSSFSKYCKTHLRIIRSHYTFGLLNDLYLLTAACIGYFPPQSLQPLMATYLNSGKDPSHTRFHNPYVICCKELEFGTISNRTHGHIADIAEYLKVSISFTINLIPWRTTNSTRTFESPHTPLESVPLSLWHRPNEQLNECNRNELSELICWLSPYWSLPYFSYWVSVPITRQTLPPAWFSRQEQHRLICVEFMVQPPLKPWSIYLDLERI